jgi:hypothetical protein
MKVETEGHDTEATIQTLVMRKYLWKIKMKTQRGNFSATGM